MNDWKVEVIASKLCSHFGFSHIEQKPCIVYIDGSKFYGVYSSNYSVNSESFISFEKLLSSCGISSNDSWSINCSAIEKIKRMSVNISYASSRYSRVGVLYEDVLKYMLSCAMIDILVYNNDRHTRNYCLYLSSKGLSIAPMFDFGMGLFENDIYLRSMNSWEDCNRYCYIAPFGEDAFDLLELLDSSFNIRRYYKRVQKPVVDKRLFPSDKSYQYFKEVCSRIW